MFIMSPDLCRRYTFEAFGNFENQPLDKNGLGNSIKIKIITRSEVLGTSAETPSVQTVLFFLLTT